MGSSPFQLQQPFFFFFSKSFILSIFLCKNWKCFSRISQNQYVYVQTVQKTIYIYIYLFIYFRSILDNFAKKFLEHLRLYFLGPSVQRFLLCYSPSIQITQFITHHKIKSHIIFHSPKCTRMHDLSRFPSSPR